MNPATEFVDQSRDFSPVHAYVADHGEAVDSSTIDHVTIAGRPVAVSNDLTSDERALVADAIRATQPVTGVCYANALEMWAYDSRFKYAEGFAAASHLDIDAFEHAWCMIDGEKLVDVTKPFDHYHGAIIADDEALHRHYEIGEAHDNYGVVGNHHNRFEFLRNRGYVDG